MQKKLEHIGIAVKDLKSAEKIFTDVLGTNSYKHEEVISENVITSFFATENTKIELLQATNEESAIAKFIAKKGEGLHHLAFLVPDLKSEINRLENLGYHIIQEPKKGADGLIICFLHPKEVGGVLVELCQKIENA